MPRQKKPRTRLAIFVLDRTVERLQEESDRTGLSYGQLIDRIFLENKVTLTTNPGPIEASKVTLNLESALDKVTLNG